MGRPPLPVPKTVCRNCDHFGTKVRRHENRTIDPPHVSERSMECTWFQTSAGRSASSDLRLSVMHCSLNGGRDCPVVLTSAKRS